MSDTEILAYTDSRITELEKENARLEKEVEQLKAYESHWDEIEEDAKRIAEENAELNRDKTELVNSVTELEKKVTELEKQIEKMKCCEKCRHNGSDRAIGENGDYTDYTCIQCDDLSTKENPYPNWELGE